MDLNKLIEETKAKYPWFPKENKYRLTDKWGPLDRENLRDHLQDYTNCFASFSLYFDNFHDPRFINTTIDSIYERFDYLFKIDNREFRPIEKLTKRYKIKENFDFLYYFDILVDQVNLGLPEIKEGNKDVLPSLANLLAHTYIAYDYEKEQQEIFNLVESYIPGNGILFTENYDEFILFKTKEDVLEYMNASH